MEGKQITITIKAPAKCIEKAVKAAGRLWCMCKKGGGDLSMIRPTKDRPFFVHFDGTEIDIEWIPEDKINSLNEVLTEMISS